MLFDPMHLFAIAVATLWGHAVVGLTDPRDTYALLQIKAEVLARGASPEWMGVFESWVGDDPCGENGMSLNPQLALNPLIAIDLRRANPEGPGRLAGRRLGWDQLPLSGDASALGPSPSHQPAQPEEASGRPRPHQRSHAVRAGRVRP